MIRIEDMKRVKTLFKNGVSIRKIVLKTGISRMTVIKIVNGKHPLSNTVRYPFKLNQEEYERYKEIKKRKKRRRANPQGEVGTPGAGDQRLTGGGAAGAAAGQKVLPATASESPKRNSTEG